MKLSTPRALATQALIAALCIAPTSAFAMCYTIFDAKNEVVYRSDTPPFDLSTPTSEAIKKSRFAGGYLRVTPDLSVCYPVGVQNSNVDGKLAEPQYYYRRLPGKD